MSRARRWTPPPRPARGVALLTMLLVTALVALLATTLLTQQARLLPREGQVDRYSTRKALAFGEEARFRAELRADLAASEAVDGVMDAWLTPQERALGAGTLYRRSRALDALINVNNLTSPAALERFGRLLSQLGIELKLAEEAPEALKGRRRSEVVNVDQGVQSSAAAVKGPGLQCSLLRRPPRIHDPIDGVGGCQVCAEFGAEARLLAEHQGLPGAVAVHLPREGKEPSLLRQERRCQQRDQGRHQQHGEQRDASAPPRRVTPLPYPAHRRRLVAWGSTLTGPEGAGLAVAALAFVSFGKPSGRRQKRLRVGPQTSDSKAHCRPLASGSKPFSAREASICGSRGHSR